MSGGIGPSVESDSLVIPAGLLTLMTLLTIDDSDIGDDDEPLARVLTPVSNSLVSLAVLLATDDACRTAKQVLMPASGLMPVSDSARRTDPSVKSLVILTVLLATNDADIDDADEPLIRVLALVSNLLVLPAVLLTLMALLAIDDIDFDDTDEPPSLSLRSRTCSLAQDLLNKYSTSRSLSCLLRHV